MRIGIYAKMDGLDGTPHRALEMANAITKYTGNQVTILCERNLNPYHQQRLDPNVQISLETIEGRGLGIDQLYQFDSLLIINSDDQDLSTIAYWEGQTKRHNIKIDIGKIKQMIYLYNFNISPASKLQQIAEKCHDLRIILANTEYNKIINTQDKFKPIRTLPRIILESPITNISTTKTLSNRIRIGRHSLPQQYKYNEHIPQLINNINKTHEHTIIWDFMGIPSNKTNELTKFKNVIIRKEYSTNVKEYLMNIDIFLFFISFTRIEPWSRCVAEAQISGCPVLATPIGGNIDQILDQNNGYLCKDLDEFHNRLSYLIENPNLISILGRNSKIYAKRYSPICVISKFIDFITS